jgi:hypothetical protein
MRIESKSMQLRTNPVELPIKVGTFSGTYPRAALSLWARTRRLACLVPQVLEQGLTTASIHCISDKEGPTRIARHKSCKLFLFLIAKSSPAEETESTSNFFYAHLTLL